VAEIQELLAAEPSESGQEPLKEELSARQAALDKLMQDFEVPQATDASEQLVAVLKAEQFQHQHVPTCCSSSSSSSAEAAGLLRPWTLRGAQPVHMALGCPLTGSTACAAAVAVVWALLPANVMWQARLLHCCCGDW